MQSLANKPTIIHDLLTERSLDLTILTETWIKNSEANYHATVNQMLPPGSRFLHRPRAQSKRGGGVGVVVSQRYNKNVSQLADKLYVHSRVTTFEHIAIRVCPNSAEGFIILVIYRPPKSSESVFRQEIESILTSLRSHSSNIILCGDLNIHLDMSSLPAVVSFNEILEQHELSTHSTGPTHRRGHTLDIVASNLKFPCTTVDLAISDHSALVFTVNLDNVSSSNQTTSPPTPCLRRVLNTVNVNSFTADITSNFSDFESQDLTDTSLLVERFNTTLVATLDKHAPLKNVKHRSKRLDFVWSEEINEHRLHRRKLERRYSKSGLEVDRQILKTKRKLISRLVASEKRSLYKEKISSCANRQKELFSIVSSLSTPTEASVLPNHPIELLPDLFADFFSSKIDTILATFSDTSDINSTCTQSMNSNCPQLTSFKAVTQDYLTKLRPLKTSALDMLSNELYAAAKEPLMTPITRIVNSSLISGVFPTTFKEARVTPIPKSGCDRTQFASFRPVSNLSYMSKLVEATVADQLTDHLARHSLLNPYQSAYRQNHSTETALLHVQSELLTHLDQGRSAFLVLLDLSAAFDTLNHNLLLSRISTRFSVNGTVLKWLTSYLTDRTFRVGVQGILSSQRQLKVGVPQGSVLGPILFNMYTTPLLDIFIKHGVAVHFYADDTQFWVPFNPKDDASEAAARLTVLSVFNDIQDWMSSNHLKLNASKTMFLPVCRFRPWSDYDSINLGHTSIAPSKKVRNLGVIFNSTLTMDDQVNSVVKASFFHLRRLNSIRQFLPEDMFITLVHAFVSNRLDMGNSLYYNMTSKLLSKLQNVHNAAAKSITKSRKYDSASAALHQLHWLPMKQRIFFKIASVAHRIVSGDAPRYFTELVVKKESLRATRLSASGTQLSCPKFQRPRLKTYGDRCFYAGCISVWNTLPPTLRSITSLKSFQANLKTYLFR